MARQPQRPICPPFLSLGPILTGDQADQLLATSGAQQLRRPRPGELAQTTVRWAKENQWLFGAFTEAAMRAREHAYPFTFAGFAEPFVLSRYSAAEPFEQPWRMDAGAGASSARKLTMVCELSPPSYYEGAELEVYGPKGPALVEQRAQGAVTVFPSYAVHRVRQIRQGVRWALTAFLTGPAFV